MTAGLVLDAGAFVALENGSPQLLGLTRAAAERGTPLVTSAGVVAQIWRGGSRRQVPVAFLLRRTEVIDLTSSQARLVGILLGASRTADPVDAHVAMIASARRWPVVTSDPGDLHAIDARLDLIPI